MRMCTTIFLPELPVSMPGSYHRHIQVVVIPLVSTMQMQIHYFKGAIMAFLLSYLIRQENNTFCLPSSVFLMMFNKVACPDLDSYK